jgi:hypothetical protein
MPELSAEKDHIWPDQEPARRAWPGRAGTDRNDMMPPNPHQAGQARLTPLPSIRRRRRGTLRHCDALPARPPSLCRGDFAARRNIGPPRLRLRQRRQRAQRAGNPSHVVFRAALGLRSVAEHHGAIGAEYASGNRASARPRERPGRRQRRLSRRTGRPSRRQRWGGDARERQRPRRCGGSRDSAGRLATRDGGEGPC